MYVSGRYHPNELVSIPQGKGDVQPPPFSGFAESMKARLNLVVLCIGQRPKRGIEKNLFGLSHRNVMMRVLPGVTFVPFEANYLREIGNPCISL
jgi:hypothetical protein